MNNQRILLIDDEVPILEFIKASLSREGYEVDVADDGAVGWDALQAKTYDLVVTDNLMPNLTGLGLIKLLKDVSIKIPVIMITGTVPWGAFQNFPSLRPEAILQKPFSTKELLHVVHDTLGSAQPAEARC